MFKVSAEQSCQVFSCCIETIDFYVCTILDSIDPVAVLWVHAVLDHNSKGNFLVVVEVCHKGINRVCRSLKAAQGAQECFLMLVEVADTSLDQLLGMCILQGELLDPWVSGDNIDDLLLLRQQCSGFWFLCLALSLALASKCLLRLFLPLSTLALFLLRFFPKLASEDSVLRERITLAFSCHLRLDLLLVVMLVLKNERLIVWHEEFE